MQLYRQDCETFRTVVKMLVAKEPRLDNLLQAPLDENLLEIKQRCLEDLRHFVKDLDEVLEATGRKTLNMESYSGDQSFFCSCQPRPWPLSEARLLIYYRFLFEENSITKLWVWNCCI